ncbi:hypothetical protein PR048_018393 [Dryococelus australis]|uniref:Cytochrome P450 n=1 Tax=Dryococelus australis TaxID=614101 RepID=A0ABQ9HC58_9NEOP|nr:hypothetical protein PR048_018393 [Dryococelus australis]
MPQVLWYFSAFLVTAVFLAIVFCVRFLRSQRYLLGTKIPGPAPIPLLGNLHTFAAQTSRVLEFLKEVIGVYGPTCRFWFGTHLVVAVFNPTDVQTVVSSRKMIDKPFFYKPLRKLWGCGLSSEPLVGWKKHRKIMDPAFRVKLIESFVDVFKTKSEILADRLRSHADEQPFDVLGYALKFTIDNTTQTTLGTSVDFQTGESSELMEDFLDMKNSVWQLVLLNKLCTFQNGRESCLMTKKELRDQSIHVTITAMDTSAIALSTVLMLLGLHQDVQQRVIEEQKRVLCDDRHRSVKLEELREIVLKESLRLFPPLPIMGRRVQEAVDIEGYTLPAGSTVIIPIYLIHRDPRSFTRPEEFYPDRFHPSNCQGRHPCSFIPFSTGRRDCIGKTYASVLLKTALSIILRQFEILPCMSREQMEAVGFQVTIEMKHGYKIKLRPRLW